MIQNPIPQLTILADTGFEPDETVILGLRIGNGLASIGVPNATLTLNDSAEINVSVAAVSITEGATAHFTINLGKTNRTGSPITVNYQVSGDDYSPPGNAVTIISNGQSAISIFVPIHNNNLFEGDRDLMFTLTGTSDSRVTIGTASATTRVEDNEVVIASVSGSPASIAEDGGIGIFTISLDHINQTGSPITVEYTLTGDSTRYTANPTTGEVEILNNANSATVSITGVSNPIMDGNEDITLTLVDVQHSQVTANNTPASITLLDNDVAGVTISTTSLTVTEDDPIGATYQVVLTSQPTDDVSITLASGELDTPTDLTFTSVNWNVPQTVNVRALDDAQHGNGRQVTISHTVTSTDTNYDALTVSDVVVDIEEVTTVTIIADQPFIDEDSITPATFTVDLGRPNTTGGSITVPYTVTGSAVAGTDYQAVSGTVDILDTEQTITIELQPIPNNIIDAPNREVIVTLGTSAITGVTFDPTPASIVITDNDSAGVVVAPTSLTVSEDDPTGASYQVVLTSQPTDDVTITVTSGELDTPTDLTFTMADWNVPQTVWVLALDDAQHGNGRQVTITHAVTSTDANYDAFAAPDVVVDIEEVTTVTVVADQPFIDEDSITPATFTVDLGRPNTTGGSITVPYTVTGSAVAGTDYQALSGTVDILDTEQTITIELQPIPNNIIDAPNREVIVTLDTSTITGVTFDPTPATIVITDNDSAGVVMTPLTLTVTEDDPAGDVYQVALTAQPTDDVIITIDAGELTTDTIELTFTVVDWYVPQSITVTADANTIDNDDRVVFITHTITTTDLEYQALTADDVTVNVLDATTVDVPNVVDVVDADGNSLDGVTYQFNIDRLTIQFNSAVFDDGAGTHPDSASNPANYILLAEGNVAGFQTTSCIAGVSPDDTPISFASVSYDNRITALTFDHALTDGSYRLIICGTTSIVSAINPTWHLNNGVDVMINFTITTPQPQPAPTLAQPEDLGIGELPATGERPIWAELLSRWFGW